MQSNCPVQRSAFTYWEDSIPARIDLGKSKYGGQGFVFPNTRSRHYNTCVCDQLLVNDRYVKCNSTSAQITVYSGKWLGSIAENGTQLVVVNCPFDYRKLGMKTVSNGNFDGQCYVEFFRTGIACSDR